MEPATANLLTPSINTLPVYMTMVNTIKYIGHKSWGCTQLIRNATALFTSTTFSSLASNVYFQLPWEVEFSQLPSLSMANMFVYMLQKNRNCYFNYKKTFSINLMAVASPDYRLVLSTLVRLAVQAIPVYGAVVNLVKHGKTARSRPRPLPGTNDNVEYAMVGDEAFPFQSNLRPYPRRDLDSITKKRYNYRLSRARHVVENAFGILSKRRVLFTPTDADATKAASIVRTCCVLHNMLAIRADSLCTPRFWWPPFFQMEQW